MEEKKDGFFICALCQKNINIFDKISHQRICNINNIKKRVQSSLILNNIITNDRKYPKLQINKSEFSLLTTFKNNKINSQNYSPKKQRINMNLEKNILTGKNLKVMNLNFHEKESKDLLIDIKSRISQIKIKVCRIIDKIKNEETKKK